MRSVLIPCSLFLCVSMILLSGCEREKDTTPATVKAPAMEVGSRKPEGTSINVALNKAYTVDPQPDGYSKTFTTDATDGRKPVSVESCFGYSRHNTSESIALDIDLGREEKINGATLYTFFNKYDEENNNCDYGANYVEVFGSKNGSFTGEEKLLGKDGEPESAIGETGKCFFEIQSAPHTYRYLRFVVKKQFGDGATGTDWLFIKEAEVWKAVR